MNTSSKQPLSDAASVARQEPTTRNKERTRAAILDAAKVLFLEHGTATSIADIAHEAGISKSGLLHHFSSKDELIEALVKSALEQFESSIMARVDWTGPLEGRLMRAYISALTSSENHIVAMLSPTGLLSKFERTPALDELYKADSAKWRERFMSDGLPLGVMATVRGASESFAVDRGTTWLTEEEFQAGRDFLLSLTYIS